MDERIREIERRAQAGDPGARAELLLARIRLGELRQDLLAAAAALGHEPSAQVLGRDPVEPGAGLLLERIERWGRVAALQATLGIAHAPGIQEALSQYVSDLYPSALEAAMAVEREPTPEHRTRARELADTDVEWSYWRWYQSQEGLRALGVARCAGAQDEAGAYRALLATLYALVQLPGSFGWPDDWERRVAGQGQADAVAALAQGLDEQLRLVAAMRQGLIAWLLGEAISPPPAPEVLTSDP